jgi:hypothetical protein
MPPFPVPGKPFRAPVYGYFGLYAAAVSHCMGSWLVVFCCADEGREVHDDQFPGAPAPIRTMKLSQPEEPNEGGCT